MKLLILKLYGSRYPFAVKVFSRYQTLCRVTVRERASVLYVCTTGTVAISAEYGGVRQTRFVSPVADCTEGSLYFDFNTRNTEEIPQRFLLNDFNYGFPVRSATLFFTGG